MASTASTSLRLELQADGENQGTWGSKTNTNLGTLLEQAIAGWVQVSVAAVDVTLTATNYASDQARNAAIELTGALGASINVIVPTVTKQYLISNATSNAFSITVKTAAGTGIVVPQGTKVALYCDGTNVVQGANAVVGTFKATTVTATTVTGTTINGTTITATNLTPGTLSAPLSVPNGGTGVGTLTTHGVLLGQGTGNVTATAVGTAGQVLTSNGAADPSYIDAPLGSKNRLINGAMRFDQRKTGSALTITNANQYALDRWFTVLSAATTATLTRQSGASAQGNGFWARTQRTSGTGLGPLALAQVIESTNMGDLQGQQVTLSFWARKGANYSATSSALAFTVQTGTVADEGSTSFSAATWTGQTTAFSGTATLTTSFQKFTATGTLGASVLELAVQFVFTPTGTAGANDYYDITDVQLELGANATAFDRLDYGIELLRCQRYLPMYSGATNGTASAGGQVLTSVSAIAFFQFPAQTRVTPTGITVSANNHFTVYNASGGQVATTAIAFNISSQFLGMVTASVAAGIVQGNATALVFNNASAQIFFTGCEL